MTLENGKLVMTAGRMTYAFAPWAGDIFRVTENSPSGQFGQHPFFATFDVDPAGRVEGFQTTTGARFKRLQK